MDRVLQEDADKQQMEAEDKSEPLGQGHPLDGCPQFLLHLVYLLVRQLVVVERIDGEVVVGAALDEVVG